MAKSFSMRFRIRSLLVGVTLIAIVAGLLSYHAKRRRMAIEQLFENGLEAIQFSDNSYYSSLDEIEGWQYWFTLANVAYVDIKVPDGNSEQVIPRLTQLPWLGRVIVRYQGDDFAEFRREREEIYTAMETATEQLRQDLPGVEVLKVDAVAEWK